MKNKLFVVVLSLLSSISHISKADEINIATTAYAPFVEQNAEYGGFVNRVIKEAYKRVGHKVTFTFLPWKRVLVASEKAEYDGASFSFPNTERESKYYFSHALSEHKELFFSFKIN